MPHQMFHKLCLLLAIAAPVFSVAEEVITVTSAAELYHNIGPDRTIKVPEGTYLLTSMSQQDPTKYCHFVDSYDGPELVITGVKNLTIVGIGKKQPLIMVSPRYADVIEFRDCENITIENIRAGHGPEKGHCTGGVLAFESCSTIVINNCSLYGCGTQGIGFYESVGLRCNGTIIEECSYHIMSIMGAKNVEFTDCEFRNNEQYDMVQLMESDRIHFLRCSFNNNTSEGSSWSDYAIFKTRNASDVAARSCTFDGNEMDHLVSGNSAVTVKESKEPPANAYRKGRIAE